MSRVEEIRRLRREAPRSRFLRWSGVALGALVVASWSDTERWPFALFRGQRVHNLERFLERELVPYPLRNGDRGPADLFGWARDLFAAKGGEATLSTLAISALAILLAAACAWTLGPLAARNLSTARPAEDLQGKPESRAWRAVRGATFALFVALRALPEYILAYLLVALLGPGHAWPAVLALGVHNAGILGRLSAESVENLEPAPLQALRTSGARRSDLIVAAVWPLSINRWLTYFFYRFETCVRESTALGMLGIASLGYWISDAQANHYYDEVFFFVGLSGLIVVVADFASARARRSLREGDKLR
ncbi:MAG: ABC transporter permease subunit [Planctomycetes bacterium]|nr:ABC transporter permease subunit [Planctomycetota bacterium]